MNWPNLYIVGPPRSGTTSLHEWLAQHPDVGRPELKEPLYHATDLATPQRVADRTEYLGLYEGFDAARYRIDASPWYLYSRDAASSIRDVAPDAHIVVMLRNPADMLASLHGRHVLVGLEPERDLVTAIFDGPAQEDPDEFRRSLDYLAVGRVGEQVSRYLDCFPREQIHFVELAAMSSRPQATHLDLLRALGLTPVQLQHYEKFNAARTVRNRAMAWATGAIAGGRRSDRVRRAVASRIARRASVPGRDMVPPSVRRRLSAALADDVALLAELSGRDLSAWRA